MPDMSDFLYSTPLLGIPVTLGNLAVWLGLISAVTCVLAYWTAMLRSMRSRSAPTAPEPVRKKNGKAGRSRPAPDSETDRVLLWGRRFFYLTSVCVVVAAASLWTLLLTRQYAVAYVFKNSNNHLPLGFRIASFWSDQEGTFVLWALYNAILGAVLLRKAREDERWVMPFFTLVNVSLFTLLTFMNPFWIQSPHEVRQALNAELDRFQADDLMRAHILAFLPTSLWSAKGLAYYFGWGTYWRLVDGRGLNELLQNFWMVIHPPTLFVGYSSMMIPSCFALGALMRRDYDTWAVRAMPWLAFAWGVLGTGIFLGAYWSYETLNWGGYWAWDPVENASLLPWLVGTALIHGLLAQRARGNFKHANLFLGLMAGTAVLLGSFLVRSGVLEGSVHAFATPQKSVFYTLVAILVLWFLMSLAIWIWRYRDIQSEIAYEHVWERHFGFFLGLISLSATAIVVTVGVFVIPVLLPIFLHKKQNVEFTFYNKALLPITFVTVALMTLTPLMPWRRAGRERPLNRFNRAVLVLAGLITVFFLVAAYLAYRGGFVTQNDPAYVAFGLMLALGVVTNAVCLRRAARGGLLNCGPWLAHIGFLVMLGGVVLSSRFNTTHEVRKIEVGESVRILGREFIYRGQQAAASPLDRDRLVIDMRRPDGSVVRLRPKLFISRVNDQPAAWPAIVHEWFGGALGDIYIAPSGADSSNIVTLDEVAKNTTEPVHVVVQQRKGDPEDQVWLTFRGLDTREMQRVFQGSDAREFRIYADVLLNVNGVERRVRPALRIIRDPDGVRTEPEPLPLPELRQSSRYALLFRSTNLDPANLTASFELRPERAYPQAFFQVLHVPGIQVLWFGVYIMLAGAALTWRRRALLARRPVPAPATEPVPAREPRPVPAGAE